MMTPTTRWTMAQRRKRQVISRTVRERASRDPRRAVRRTETPAGRRRG